MIIMIKVMIIMVRVISNFNDIIILLILMIILILIFLKNFAFQFLQNSVSQGYIWLCKG